MFEADELEPFALLAFESDVELVLELLLVALESDAELVLELLLVEFEVDAELAGCPVISTS